METALTRALDDLKAQRDQLREQLALADQAVESLERFVKAQRGVVKIDTPRRSPRHPHSGNGVPSGPEGIKEIVSMFRAGFPDLEITIDEQVAEGDLVCSRTTMRGTHRGHPLGYSGNGQCGNNDRINNGTHYRRTPR